MRVLWFTNNPMPAMMGQSTADHAGTGGWMVGMLGELAHRQELELAVCCVSPDVDDGVTEVDNIRYYTIGQASPRFHYLTAPDDDARYLRKCQAVARTYRPDIVHVNGTERMYGLLSARGMLTCPTVISMQGLLRTIVPRHVYWGKLTLAEIMRVHTLRSLASSGGAVAAHWRMMKHVRREAEIIAGNRFFFGHTMWDKAHVLALNPAAHYFHEPRILRGSFFENTWSLDGAKRNRLIYTNARSPLRGVEVLLDAVCRLGKRVPDVSVALAGIRVDSPYGRVLKRHVKTLGLDQRVDFLGVLNERELISEMLHSHVFSINSFVENESNSLCEAQLLGMPCVASYAGGMPSTADFGRSALLYPPRDEAVLCEQLYALLSNDEKAMKLGEDAAKSARQRHDRTHAVDVVLDAYRRIIETETSS